MSYLFHAKNRKKDKLTYLRDSSFHQKDRLSYLRDGLVDVLDRFACLGDGLVGEFNDFYFYSAKRFFPQVYTLFLCINLIYYTSMNKFLQALIAISFCFFLSHHSSAQQWKHYGAKSKANCFLVAKDSTLWVGTDGGVIHYDKNYKVIESDNHSNGPDSNVVSLIQDVKGNILASIRINPSLFFWFDGYSWQSTGKMKIPFQPEKTTLFEAYNNGDDRWNSDLWLSYDKGTKFIQFSLDSIYNQNAFVNKNIIEFKTNSVTDDDSNNIWITNYKSLYLFNGAKWITYNTKNSSLPDLAFHSPIADSDSSVLLLTSEGVIRFNSKSASYVLIKTTNPTHLIKTKNGKIFVAREKQILALNGNVLTEYLTDNSLAGVTAFASDAENRLIIGTNTSNYLNDGQKLTTLDLPKLNLEGNNIGMIEPDTKGSIWVATYWPSKLFKINDSKNEIQSFPYSIGAMAVGKDNTFWIAEGQPGTLKQYDGNKWISYTLKENSRIVKIVVDENNYVWCNVFNWNNYQSSLFWFDGNIWKSLDLEENYLGYGFDIAPKVGGGIWMNDYNLLKSFDGTTFTSYPSNSENKLPDRNLLLLKTSSNGTLWIVSDEKSIYKLDGKIAQKIQFPTTINFDYIYDGLFIDKDENLWIGSTHNLYKYDGKTWKKFDAGEGPINITSITQSNDGRIWVGTYNGLYVMTDCVSKPTITLQPKHTSVFEFQKAQLEIKAESANSFEWQLSKDKGLTWKNISNFDTSYVGHRTNILTIKSSNLSQSNDIYRCQISNECSSVNSDTASVTIKKCLQTPQIIQQPNPQSAIENSGVQFTVSSSNTSTYQWEVSADALAWKQISSQDTLYSGQQTNTLNIKSTNILQNSYSYRCLLKNECFQIYSLSASLEVITILGNEALIEKSFIAYPNPAQDNLHVKAPIKPYKLTLLSDKGSVIKQVENQDIISVKDIPNGIYILLLETDKGKQSLKITVLK